MYSETFPRVKVVLLTFRSWEGGRIKEAVRRKGGGNVKDEGGRRKEEGGRKKQEREGEEEHVQADEVEVEVEVPGAGEHR